MKKIVNIAVLLLLLSSCSVFADTVIFAPGTTNQTTALTGFSTTGSMMDGMSITAYFSGGSSQTATWATTGVGEGSAVGTGWSLAESGDTFGGLWTLNTGTNTMTRLLIDAGPGDTVFDTTAIGDIAGTDGSARGWSFERTSANPGLDVTATYLDYVALTGFAPVGDLFRYLDLSFQQATGAAGFSGIMEYISDTDNLKFAGDLRPVPEPATILLLGAGIVGLIGFRRIKK
jgi:hypothetical protein